MERSTDHLIKLPIDLLLQQLTYLPFKDVITICTSNAKLHSYCSDPKYNNNWRQLIDNTFGSVYDYQNKLKKIWSKLNLLDGTYNYVVYTKFIDLLDPITQLMIYYRQGDTKSFNNYKFSADQRFLAMFLLNKPEEMRKYKPRSNINPSYYLLQGKNIATGNLNLILFAMVINGNIRGIKYLIEKGANIHAENDEALRLAERFGRRDVVKYLEEQIR